MARLGSHVRPIWYRVKGGSMEPTFAPGDEVRLELARGRIVVGDVVVVRGVQGNLMIHRVVSLSARAIVTRGDACPFDDLPITPGRVLLKAVELRRAGRGLPIPAPPARALRPLRSILRRCRASLSAVRGRWWTARPSSSTSTGGGSWA